MGKVCRVKQCTQCGKKKKGFSGIRPSQLNRDVLVNNVNNESIVPESDVNNSNVNESVNESVNNESTL